MSVVFRLAYYANAVIVYCEICLYSISVSHIVIQLIQLLLHLFRIYTQLSCCKFSNVLYVKIVGIYILSGLETLYTNIVWFFLEFVYAT